MQLLIEDIKKLFQSKLFFNLRVGLQIENLSTSSSFLITQNSDIEFYKTINLETLQKIEKQNHNTIEVFLDNEEIEKAKKILPNLFYDIEILTTAEKAFSEYQQLAKINNYTKKKRHLYFARDIEDKVSSLGYKMLLCHAEKEINDKILHSIINKKGKDFPISLCFKEKDVLIFTNLKSKEYSNNNNLLNILKRLKLNYQESHSVNDCFEKYKKNNFRLILISDLDNSLEAQHLFIKIKQFDSIARTLGFLPLDIDLKFAFSNYIKEFYNKPYADIVQEKIEQKKIEIHLSKPIQEKLLNNISELTTNYSLEKHVKITYQLFILEKQYNIENLKRALQRIQYEI